MVTILEPFNATFDYSKSREAMKMNLGLERCRIVVSYLVSQLYSAIAHSTGCKTNSQIYIRDASYSSRTGG